ncbi:MAG: hypothetical protein RO009_22985 [Pseudorhodoplanes sp.]|nr:hypothetical protein [Pseudorhodoplanes sp.]
MSGSFRREEERRHTGVIAAGVVAQERPEAAENALDVRGLRFRTRVDLGDDRRDFLPPDLRDKPLKAASSGTPGLSTTLL